MSTDSLLAYGPSWAIEYIGGILYAGVAAATVLQFFRYRAWCFCIMVIAALGDVVGFNARIYSFSHPDDTNAFLMAQIIIILAPSLMAIACHIIFGRMVWMVTPQHKRNFRTLWVPPRFIVPIFVLFDLLSLFLQCIGLGLIAGASDEFLAGNGAWKAGLILQLLCFIAFALISARFLLVSRRWSATETSEKFMHWRRLGWALDAATALILLRTIYRVVESTGTISESIYLVTHEWPFWLFDAVPIYSVLWIFIIIHPGMYLPKSFTGLRLDEKALAKPESELSKVNLAPMYPSSATYFQGSYREDPQRLQQHPQALYELDS